ncbi:MAG: hypothetical protein MI975_04055 [Cytophagales bacterium]|nr:hypothetical protein [Cytophagales bacterium]
MSKIAIYILLIVLGALAAYIILEDLIKNEMLIRAENPYAFDLKEFEEVDPALIKYHETKRVKLDNPFPKAIDYHKGFLAMAFQNHLQVIDTSGREIFNRKVPGPSTAICISEKKIIYLGCKTRLEVYDFWGDLLDTWQEIDTGAYITSIAIVGGKLFVANAGGPEIIRYDKQGEIELKFDGKNQESKDHGFVVPSPYFDVDIDPEDDLWIANTGLQNIQNYTKSGSLRGYWGNSGYNAEDFTGCCNPAHFTILSDGSFVTCEKGLVRIKVHKPSGKLDAFVAAPKDFAKNSGPLDLASDEHDHIYALDITQKMVRKFERK